MTATPRQIRYLTRLAERAGVRVPEVSTVAEASAAIDRLQEQLGVERKTRRQRREERADRLEEWAESREAKSDVDYAKARQMADAIPLGQPILVGHHSERTDRNYRDRMQSTYDRSFEHAAKAREMASKAANIRAANDHAIYDDDPDAIERLEAKIATLEAERERIKAFNAAVRKAKGVTDGALALLDDKQRAQYHSVVKHSAYSLGKHGQMPSYHLSNLGGVISATRRRADILKRRKAS